MSHAHTVTVHAPAATSVAVVVSHEAGDTVEAPLLRDEHGTWSVAVDASPGDRYWLIVDGEGPLLDPHASDVVFDERAHPWSMVRGPWPKRSSLGRHHTDPIVYELHVRNFARTFAGVAEHLDHIAGLGANVVELMPVHPFDTTDNAWGYMPVVWGAVHRPFAAGEDAAAELADLIANAHERGLEVWLDVVFNHTGEGEATMPTWCLRGIDDANAYLHRADGSYNDDAGCGNVADPSNAQIRELVLEALDRYADLGFDGFRFDLASILTRDVDESGRSELVAQITAWAASRRVVLIAEPWDLAAYQVGSSVWPDEWAQWNDRFRDQVRGFVRGEPGLVGALQQRLQGSPDLFASPQRSINFVTAHDGLTLHDLTIVTSDHHHSWDCGPELRMQQLTNLFTLLLLSAGTPMFVMGDEFARTQGGDPNPYDVDGPSVWVDWDRLAEWHGLCEYVRALIELRRECPPTAPFRFHGVDVEPDHSFESRSLAWCSGDLYVMANAWWEPLMFGVHEPGPWDVALATAGWAGDPSNTVEVPPRSIVVLRRAG